jgi:putative SOS response-associated peptidase YedK
LDVCNTFIAKPRKGFTGWKAQVSKEIEKLKSSLIRKSDPGVVVLAGKATEENPFTPHTMRWGFHRPFNAAINNSRSDKLESAVWKESFQNRRCLIPVSTYYEWGEAIGGRKQAYEITGPYYPDYDWLWIAGIWEENPELGPCYSMITTAAAPTVSFIHDRMPAILPWETAAEFLSGGKFEFSPFTGPLAASPCTSPLARKKPDDGPKQGELF